MVSLMFYLPPDCLVSVSTKLKGLSGRNMWASELSGLSKQSKADVFLICSLNSDTVLCTEVVRELVLVYLWGVNN